MLRLTLHSCARRRCYCYEVRIVLVHVTFDTITSGKECVEALYEEGMSFKEGRHTLYDGPPKGRIRICKWARFRENAVQVLPSRRLLGGVVDRS